MDVEQFVTAIASQNPTTLNQFFHPDAIIRWPCTNEVFTLADYLSANCDYPGTWQGEVERVETTGNTVILVYHVWSLEDAQSSHCVSFIQLKENRICEMDEYWADDSPIPDWRKQKQLGKPING